MKFFASVLILSLIVFVGLVYFFTYVPVESGQFTATFPDVSNNLRAIINLYVPTLIASLAGIGGGAVRYLFDRRTNARVKPSQAFEGAVYAFFGFALIIGGATISVAGLQPVAAAPPVASATFGVSVAVSYGAAFGFLGRNLLAIFDFATPARV